MKLDLLRKVSDIRAIAQAVDSHRQAGRSVVLCHGCFDIVHPGHLRYLQFARQQGDVLVVSITGDDAIEKSDGTRPYVPQELRAENLAALEFVDHVAIAEDPTAEPVLRALRPDVYVKGKEYEHSDDPRFLAERKLVEEAGGRVIFSSGDVVFSSSQLIENMHVVLGGRRGETGFGEPDRLTACCRRWGLDAPAARRMVGRDWRGKRVIVVGDAMFDRYVLCDATGVAGEAPMLSVRPLDETAYLGGAAALTAHLKALGAEPHLLTTVGDDDDSRELIARLNEIGIEHTTVVTRKALPTRQRYLVETQKLLKVDRTDAQPLDSTAERRMLGLIAELRSGADAAVFADHGCGAVTGPLLTQAGPLLRPAVDVIVGDVSGPRRTLTMMHEFDLLTPGERELRGAMGDFDQSLPSVAMSLMKKLAVGRLAVTMGRRGCVLFRPRETEPDDWFQSRLRSEFVPALSDRAVDPVGAGEAFTAAATLGLASGASLNIAGYLASAAAAIAIDQLGNVPVRADVLTAWLSRRVEMRPPAVATAV